MSYMKKMWAAAGVAAVNSLSDQGQKLKSGFKPLHYGKQRFFSAPAETADLRPLTAVMNSDLGEITVSGRRGDGEMEQKDKSLRQVMYLNCWGQV